MWAFLAEGAADRPGLRLTHVLYYLGGLIAIGAMSLFMTLGWERFGGWGLLCVALAYASGGLWLTRHLLGPRSQPVAAGIVAAFVVALTPLAVYGLQSGLGLWAEGRVYRDYHQLIDWRWLLMELATLASGALMVWRYRLPFLLMPVAVTLWYVGMDLTPFLFGDSDAARLWERRQQVSLVFGLAMVLLALWVDLRPSPRLDYAFWFYLFGVMSLWGGLSVLWSKSEAGRFAYLCINLVLIAAAPLLGRRVFAVFGGLGVVGYLGHLAWSVFSDSLLFPFALTAIGLSVIWLGLLWQRHEHELGQRLRASMPPRLRDLLQARP